MLAGLGDNTRHNTRGAADRWPPAPSRWWDDPGDDMSPRAYKLGQRQAAIEETRARIVVAARELLAAGDGFPGFTIDAVARQAGVARMTIYYQYSSKIGLLEAVCDSLAVSGGMGQLAAAFRRTDPIDALLDFVAVFGGFWDADRQVTRRLRGL